MVLEADVALRHTALLAFAFGVFLGGLTVLLSHALQTTVLSVVGVDTVTRFFDRLFRDLLGVGEPLKNLLATRFAVVDNFFHGVIGL